jgi:hypothetical protein
MWLFLVPARKKDRCVEARRRKKVMGPLLYVGGRGPDAALLAGLVAGLPSRFAAAASSGAALGLLAWRLGGARGLRRLMARHGDLLVGVDAPDRRLEDARALLRGLGADPEATLASSCPTLLLLAFDCEERRPVVLREGSLASALAALASVVPMRVGRRHVLDAELLLPPRLLASHLAALCCFLPAPGASPPGDPAKVLSFLDAVLARGAGRCAAPVLCLPRGLDVRQLGAWRLRAAAALLLFVLSAALTPLLLRPASSASSPREWLPERAPLKPPSPHRAPCAA